MVFELLNKLTSNKCWWKCGSICALLAGESIHIPFWQKVVCVINLMLNLHLKIDPRILLLNKVNDSMWNWPEGKTLSDLFLAARLTIAQFWKEDMTPLLTTWYKKIWIYYETARINFGITVHADKEEVQNRFAAIWLLIMSFLAQCKEISCEIWNRRNSGT